MGATKDAREDPVEAVPCFPADAGDTSGLAPASGIGPGKAALPCLPDARAGRHTREYADCQAAWRRG